MRVTVTGVYTGETLAEQAIAQPKYEIEFKNEREMRKLGSGLKIPLLKCQRVKMA